jgi:hypothetical protein
VDGLLDPLTPQQQELIDVVASAFFQDTEWPVFDYLMGSFDERAENAAEILASFPCFGRWNYGAAWWVGLGQVAEPNREQVVGLTVLGAARSQALQGLVSVFFDLGSFWTLPSLASLPSKPNATPLLASPRPNRGA